MTPPRVALVLYAGFLLAAPDPVSFVRPARFITEDQEVVWQIRVEPNADNRLLVVVAIEGDVIVRRSDESLAGPHAPITHWIHWVKLPVGSLGVMALVVDAHETERARAVTVLEVLGKTGVASDAPAFGVPFGRWHIVHSPQNAGVSVRTHI